MKGLVSVPLIASLLLAFSMPVAAEPVTFIDTSTSAVLGDAAMRLLVSAEDARCSLELTLAGGLNDHGSTAISAIVRTPEGFYTGGVFPLPTGTRDTQFHAFEFVDTRGIVNVDLGNWWEAVVFVELQVAGWVEVLTWGPNLQPWPEGSWTGAHSLAATVTCDGDATVTLQVAREIRLISGESMDRGVGASNLFIGGVQVGDEAGGNYKAPEVRFDAIFDGVQVGRAVLTGPGIAAEWDLNLSSSTMNWIVVQAGGGPGPWSLQVTRAGAALSIFIGLLAGYHVLTDLEDASGLPTL